jgi:general nucleoside transport system permease protein
MNLGPITALATSAVVAAIPLMQAGLGELVTEKSGVLNLGVEGMMLMGAVTGYAVTTITGSPWVGLAAGAGAGLLMSALFGLLTLTLLANQVATGLSLTIFGIGLSAYIGKPYTSASIPISIPAMPIPGLSQIPILGPALFSLTPVDYLTFVLFIVVGWFLFRTRAGLVLRAVGESPSVAHSVGHPVLAVRYGATLFGGAMAGLAGGYYTIINLHIWQENITAGRGWIAVALVVFATWRPGRLVVGALLFGVVMALQFYAQGLGIAIPTQWLAMLPYLATIVVLVVISRNRNTIKLNSPASLGKPFFAGS